MKNTIKMHFVTNQITLLQAIDLLKVMSPAMTHDEIISELRMAISRHQEYCQNEMFAQQASANGLTHRLMGFEDEVSDTFIDANEKAQ